MSEGEGEVGGGWVVCDALDSCCGEAVSLRECRSGRSNGGPTEVIISLVVAQERRK